MPIEKLFHNFFFSIYIHVLPGKMNKLNIVGSHQTRLIVESKSNIDFLINYWNK
jgi:hypothetical protein